MMTKRHFQMIADVLSLAEERREVMVMLAKEFAKVLKRENERFDEKRFFKAVGLTEEEMEGGERR